MGGHWIARGKSSDGSTFSVEGEFLDVSPPHRLVQTWKAAWDGGHVTTITYRLDPIPGGTKVTLRHEGFKGRPDSCEGHATGWERVLGWLLGHLQPAAPLPGKRCFLCRLVPPRPSFAQDMTPAEAAAMKAHGAYWKGHAEKGGPAIVFGPVADPQGPWGLGILRVDDENELRALTENDPAIVAAIGLKYETLPLLSAIVQG